MRKWMKATSVTALMAAGLIAFGAGTANAHGGGHYDYENDSINAATSGNGSIAGGNQIIAELDVPVNVCGVAVGAVAGLANAQCEDTVAYAD